MWSYKHRFSSDNFWQFKKKIFSINQGFIDGAGAGTRAWVFDLPWGRAGAEGLAEVVQCFANIQNCFWAGSTPGYTGNFIASEAPLTSHDKLTRKRNFLKFYRAWKTSESSTNSNQRLFTVANFIFSRTNLFFLHRKDSNFPSVNSRSQFLAHLTKHRQYYKCKFRSNRPLSCWTLKLMPLESCWGWKANLHFFNKKGFNEDSSMFYANKTSTLNQHIVTRG